MLHPELLSAMAAARRRDLEEPATAQRRLWRPARARHPVEPTPQRPTGATPEREEEDERIARIERTARIERIERREPKGGLKYRSCPRGALGGPLGVPQCRRSSQPPYRLDAPSAGSRQLRPPNKQRRT
jgi:hypothetical protein